MNECKHGQVEGTIPYQKAAALLGITPKQMAGRIWRDSVGKGDPVGCKVCGYVYTDTLRNTFRFRSGATVQIELKCSRCKQRKPIKGGKRHGAGRNGGPCVFVCADCDRQARVISGTGTSGEQRELAALIRGLRACST